MEQVEYRDADHTYWFRGRRYISATQILDMFKNKFDGEAVAEQYKDKAGHDKEYWLEQWDDTRKKSLVRGNGIHNLQESITANRGTEVWGGKPRQVRNAELYLQQNLPMKQWLDGIYPEQLLYHHGYGIAGRADKLILATGSPDGKIWRRIMHIDDYKTNKIIQMHSFLHPKHGRKMMKAPLEHLEDCSWVHYVLQLSIYQFMGVYLGFLPGQRTIIHFPHIPEMAPEGALPPPPVSYQAPYLEKEVISMLKYLKARRVL